MQEGEAISSGQIKLGPGTLYGTIRRMPADGWIEESDERPDLALDDERRRNYRLTDLGGKVVRAEAQRLARLIETARPTLEPILLPPTPTPPPVVKHAIAVITIIECPHHHSRATRPWAFRFQTQAHIAGSAGRRSGKGLARAAWPGRSFSGAALRANLWAGADATPINRPTDRTSPAPPSATES